MKREEIVKEFRAFVRNHCETQLPRNIDQDGSTQGRTRDSISKAVLPKLNYDFTRAIQSVMHIHGKEHHELRDDLQIAVQEVLLEHFR